MVSELGLRNPSPPMSLATREITTAPREGGVKGTGFSPTSERVRLFLVFIYPLCTPPLRSAFWGQVELSQSDGEQQDSITLCGLSAVLTAKTSGLKKIQSMTRKHSDALETLSPNVRKRIEVLKEIQTRSDELRAKILEEKEAVEAKYEGLNTSLYSERYEIVNGLVEVEGTTKETSEETPDEEKGVPDFWLIAMKNSKVLAEEIQECDKGALKFLKDIKLRYITDDTRRLKFEFFFDPNPYFKNSILTKTYYLNGVDCVQPNIHKAIGTEIEWYQGKCLTQKLLPRKGSKNTKPCASFFNFFVPPQFPEKYEDVDDDTLKQLRKHMVRDYDIMKTLEDKIIPHAVLWFTGEAEAVAHDDDEYVGDDDEDEDSEEEEDDDEDEMLCRLQ